MTGKRKYNHETILAAYQERIDIGTIARAHGCDYHTVVTAVQQGRKRGLDLPPLPKGRPPGIAHIKAHPQALIDQIVARYNDFQTATIIAAELGMTYKAIRTIIDRAREGGALIPHHRPGRRSPTQGVSQ